VIGAMMGVLPIISGAVLGCLNVQSPATIRADNQTLEQVIRTVFLIDLTVTLRLARTA
jgi:hypothetical protein